MSLVGTTLGRIRITRHLGQGGMGDVYLGFDDSLQRPVAVKAIRDEQRVDEDAKARFLREARILSQLDHPCICRVHELIENDDSDVLVLEYIEGTSLREVLKGDTNPAIQSYIAEMLAEALVAAHDKGIAHRDLKPENIMLTLNGEVKVLDFGLSYLVDESKRPTVSASESDDLLPAPMELPDTIAPTILAAPRDLPESTVRRTVFVAGPSPSTTVAAKTTAAAASPLNIVETEHGTVQGTIAYMSPEQARGERVSVASDLYTFGLLLQEMFTGQSAYPANLKPMPMLLKAATGETEPVTGIDPDLAELITRLKSVAPEARPTAVETAERLRWIRDKPKRLFRQLAVAAGVALLVLAGLKYTYDLRQHSIEAERARQEAETARQESDAVSEYMLKLFAVTTPDKSGGEALTARELLDAGVTGVAIDLQGEPLIQSRFMYTIGRAYGALGLYEEAEPLLTGALAIRRQLRGNEHPEIAIYLDSLAALHLGREEYERAEPLLEEALRLSRRLLPSDDPNLAASLHNLANLYKAKGENQRAEPLMLQALEIQRATDSQSLGLARTHSSLGDLYRQLGDAEQAEFHLIRAIEIQEEFLGDGHPVLATSLNNLALFLHESGDATSARPLFERTLEIFEKTLGPEHPDIARTLGNLAEMLRATGDYEDALPLYVRALDIQEKALGTDHPAYAASLDNLADLKSDQGDNVKAELYYRRVLEIQEKAYGADHPRLAGALTDLAKTYARQGRKSEAEAFYRRALANLVQAVGTDPQDPYERSRMATVLIGLGKLQAEDSDEEAAASWGRAEELMKPVTANSDVAGFLHVHVLALLHQGRASEAKSMVEKLNKKGWRRPEFIEACRRHGLI